MPSWRFFFMMPKLYWALVSNSASICSAQCLFSLLSTSDWHSTCRCSKRKPNSNSLSTMYNFQAWMPALSQLKVRGAAIILVVRRNQRPQSRNVSMELLSFQLLSTMQKFCGTFLDRILSMDLVSKCFKADLQVLLVWPSLTAPNSSTQARDGLSCLCSPLPTPQLHMELYFQF